MATNIGRHANQVVHVHTDQPRAPVPSAVRAAASTVAKRSRKSVPRCTICGPGNTRSRIASKPSQSDFQKLDRRARRSHVNAVAQDRRNKYGNQKVQQSFQPQQWTQRQQNPQFRKQPAVGEQPFAPCRRSWNQQPLGEQPSSQHQHPFAYASRGRQHRWSSRRRRSRLTEI